MVERNIKDLYSCKVCPEETKSKCFVACCVGCKYSYCLDHLVEHRQQLTDKFDLLIKEHNDINEKSLKELNINQHLESIDTWEHEMIELIQQHTKNVKKKILFIFQEYKNELKQRHTDIEKELLDKRDLNALMEDSLHELSEKIKTFDKDVQIFDKSLHQITVKELNSAADKWIKSKTTIEKSTHWIQLHEIKLDSTYGYMSANDKYIYLGWKNRIVIYHSDGRKHDETRLDCVETYGELCDLIWSSTLECFFILCRKSIFVHYPSSNQVEVLLKPTFLDEDNNYISITSYKNTVFLLNKKSLDIWRLANRTCLLESSIPVKLIVKNYPDETICSIRTNEEYLAILIQNTKTRKWRLDTFSINPFRLSSIGLPFDNFQEPNLGLFMSFRNNIYLFMNWETKLMRMIDSNGNNQIIDYNAYNACLLDQQNKIIVNYMTHLKVYEF